MKILHSADWHLDAAFLRHSPQQQAQLKAALLAVPGKIADLCRREQCQLVLLSGDLFDGPYTRDSYLAAYRAMEQMQVPVFVAPGNHDPVNQASPWTKEPWPENVTVFHSQTMTSHRLPELSVWGAAFQAMEAPGLLKGFHTQELAVGVLHGDATQTDSPYSPITHRQIRESGLAYLALGHIHKGEQLRVGDTLCAWPGCPMGRGYDEPGQKGVLIVELEQTATARFVPLDTPRFYDLQIPAGEEPAAAVGECLPAAGSDDFYRITLTGPSQPVDIPALQAEFSHVPNLVLQDRTVRPADPWSTVGEDSLEGLFFSSLQAQLQEADEEGRLLIRLAASLTRKLLDGQEVVLP